MAQAARVPLPNPPSTDRTPPVGRRLGAYPLQVRLLQGGTAIPLSAGTNGQALTDTTERSTYVRVLSDRVTELDAQMAKLAAELNGATGPTSVDLRLQQQQAEQMRQAVIDALRQANQPSGSMPEVLDPALKAALGPALAQLQPATVASNLPQVDFQA